MKKSVRAFKGVKQIPLITRCIIKPYDGNAFIIIPNYDVDEEVGYIVSGVRMIDTGLNHDIQMIGYIPPHQQFWELAKHGELIIESSMHIEPTGQRLDCSNAMPKQGAKEFIREALEDDREYHCSDGLFIDCSIYYHCDCKGCPRYVKDKKDE